MLSIRFYRTLLRCRRGSVAIYIALLAPVLAGAVALGVEVSSWAGVHEDLQRTADASAYEGALTCYNYVTQSKGEETCLNTNAGAQTAATIAAQLAEVNGATGTSSASWNAGTNTYSDNNITTQITNGVKSSADAAVQVSLQKTVSMPFGQLFGGTGSEAIRASSTAEVVQQQQTVTKPGSGPQPCLLALSTSNSSVGISISGSVVATGCSLVSDSNLTASGGGSFSALGIYGAGQVPSSAKSNPSPILSIPCWMSINGSTSNSTCYNYSTVLTNPAVFPGASVVPDPYFSAAVSDPYNAKAAMQAAVANAGNLTAGPNIVCGGSAGNSCNLPSSSGSSFNGSYCVYPSGVNNGVTACYLKPGIYGSLTMGNGTNSFTTYFAAGAYVFVGNMTFSGSAKTFSGTGVTIFTTGAFTIPSGGSFAFDLTAPSSSSIPTPSTAGPWLIAGVALAGTTTSTFSVAGSWALNIDGVVYFPNAAFNGSGSNNASGATSCLEMIFNTITLSGATNLASTNCSSLNALAFDSVPATTTTTTTYATQLVK